MAQRPLSDGYTGEAPTIAARVLPSDLARMDRARQALGLNRAEYLRHALRTALDADEAVSGQSSQAVASKLAPPLSAVSRQQEVHPRSDMNKGAP
jgi:hypothetical protein